ncbi:MAG: hypothetical protein IJQ73_00130 [Kiritimatiellae bacterium]|nr:hypothetical protein [Kiritimatiellia bacterium]
MFSLAPPARGDKTQAARIAKLRDKVRAGFQEVIVELNFKQKILESLRLQAEREIYRPYEALVRDRQKFTTGIPARFEVAHGPAVLADFCRDLGVGAPSGEQNQKCSHAMIADRREKDV